MLVMVACGISAFPSPRACRPAASGPASESAQATELLVDKFGQGDMELIVSVTSEAGAQGAAPARSPPTSPRNCGRRRSSPVTSAWTAPPPAAPRSISEDGKTGLIVAGITGGESGAQKHAKELTAGSCTTATASRCAPAARR